MHVHKTWGKFANIVLWNKNYITWLHLQISKHWMIWQKDKKILIQSTLWHCVMKLYYLSQSIHVQTFEGLKEKALDVAFKSIFSLICRPIPSHVSYMEYGSLILDNSKIIYRISYKYVLLLISLSNA